MMLLKKIFLAILLCAAVLQAAPSIIYAQEPDEAAVEPLPIGPSGRLDINLQQFGYGNRTLASTRSDLFLRMNLPKNFRIADTGNYFNLITRHLPETPDQPAALRVVINGETLSTIPLTTTNALSNVVRIDLPAQLLAGGDNYMRLYLDMPSSCLSPATPLNVTIDGSSSLNFGYEQTPFVTDLAEYPYQFLTDESQRQLFNIPVTLVIPDEPTSAELSAAATLVAGLGYAAKGVIDLTTVPVGDLTPDLRDNHHLIVVGQRDNNTLLGQLDLPLPLDATSIQPGYGILQEVTSPWNPFRLVLAVSGLDDAGVLKASEALNRQAHFLGMRGPIATVLDVAPLSDLSTPTSTRMSLASMGYEDQTVYGSRQATYAYDFRLPLGWQLQDPPFFLLRFRHTDIVNPRESTLGVTLNGVPVGSTILDDSNIRGELSIALPVRLLKTGSNRLQVSVDMEHLNADYCRDLNNEQLWTVIGSESEILVPYSTVELPPNLNLFPHPFNWSSGISRSPLFILPDQPVPAALVNSLMQLAARLGSASPVGYVSVKVRYAAEVDEALQKEHHLILIGRPSTNTLVREANSSLPQPFMDDSDLPEPLVVDTVALLPDPNRTAGLLQIIDSPWSEQGTLLAVTGTNDEGIELAARILLDATGNLNGNLAVVEPAFASSATEGEPVQVSIYAIDTRPPEITDPAAVSGSALDENLGPIADRWWK